MNRRDINSINDIFQRVMKSQGSSYMKTLFESNETTNTGSQDPAALYSYGPDKLRINHFTKNGAINSTATFSPRGIQGSDLLGSDNIVVFFTKRGSDTENDILHNRTGPAVIFEQGGEGNEFFFIDGQPADQDEIEIGQTKAAVDADEDVRDTFGDFDPDDPFK